MTSRRCLAFVCILVAFLTAGCGSDSKDGSGLRIEPSEVMLTINGDQPAEQTFKVFAKQQDGSEKNVTDQVQFTLTAETGFGSFNGSTFTTGTAFGGVGEARATYGDENGTAEIRVKIVKTIIVPPSEGGDPVPENAPELFGGENVDSKAPTIIYPNNEVLLPPNMGRIELHWYRGPNDNHNLQENTVFEVAFVNDLTDVRAYLRCELPSDIEEGTIEPNPDPVLEGGCIWEPSGAAWEYIANTNRGGEPLTMQVSGTTDEGGTKGVSGSQTLAFTNEGVEGTLYYWATNAGTGGDEGRIARYEFGAAAGEAEDMFDPNGYDDSANPNPNPAGVKGTQKCYGCHSLSSDGTKLFTAALNNGEGMMLFDLENGKVIRNETSDDANVAAFASFNPEGSKFVAVRAHHEQDNRVNGLIERKKDGLLLYDVACLGTNAPIAECMTKIDLGGTAAPTDPQWSPDGSKVVFVDPMASSSATESVNTGRTGIVAIPLNAGISYVERTNDGWTGKKTLLEGPSAPAEFNNFAPSVSPDSQWVVYSHIKCGGVTSCEGQSAPGARLYLKRFSDGDAIRLDRANERGPLDPEGDPDVINLANTFAKFAPFHSSLRNSDPEKKVVWITFSSVRRYGLRQQKMPGNGRQDRAALLWMTPINLNEAADGKDASYPAFVLPFQDITKSNHIGAWTKKKVGEPPPFVF